ncbi:unnamed protein product [Acanthoscelides obtectus]|uniref:Uncharacterized protein n=1 Tax=Acanthoscelides obtectus TaxID=200917 RepID=A0A9P0NZ39_ACAOB|nr:unnamed protein product [Acanthoscelides obtectus]CAK1647208.1 hypothetical protein AOBTE_LOCUS15110 [Acanthoscelides obtectus]
MKVVITVVTLLCCSLCYVQALKCGLAKTTNGELVKAMAKCVKNNETIDNLWNGSKLPSEEDSSAMLTTTVSPKMKGGRSRRAQPAAVKPETSAALKVDKASGKNDDKMMTSTESSTDVPSSTESSETCIVQCILESVGVSDENGVPDRAKFVESILKTTSNRELRDFLQETADECFKEMNKGIRIYIFKKQ